MESTDQFSASASANGSLRSAASLLLLEGRVVRQLDAPSLLLLLLAEREKERERDADHVKETSQLAAKYILLQVVVVVDRSISISLPLSTWCSSQHTMCAANGRGDGDEERGRGGGRAGQIHSPLLLHYLYKYRGPKNVSVCVRLLLTPSTSYSPVGIFFSPPTPPHSLSVCIFFFPVHGKDKHAGEGGRHWGEQKKRNKCQPTPPLKAPNVSLSLLQSSWNLSNVACLLQLASSSHSNICRVNLFQSQSASQWVRACWWWRQDCVVAGDIDRHAGDLSSRDPQCGRPPHANDGLIPADRNNSKNKYFFLSSFFFAAAAFVTCFKYIYLARPNRKPSIVL